MVISAPPATAPAVTSLPASAVTAANPAPHGWTTHTVQPGDTLIGIAARYRTTVGTIAARNDIRDRALIVAGTRLSVPRTSAAPRVSSAGSTTAPASTVHVVRPGDTLAGIAARYGTPLASLLKTNRLSARTFIHPGQRITVRGAAATASAARSTAKNTGKATAYRVRAGDTLGSIAIRHRSSVGAIATASGISTRAVIHPGQRLMVPAAPAKVVVKATPLLDTFNGVKYPREVAEAAARNRAILATRSVPSRTQTKALIIATAHRHGVDPKLALAIAYQESGWNQRAVSPANAVGVMQVIPVAGRWASDLAGRPLDLLKTEDNITAGILMLRALGRATDTVEETAAAYYQGLGALRKNGMYADTKQYVRTVMALRKTM